MNDSLGDYSIKQKGYFNVEIRDTCLNISRQLRSSGPLKNEYLNIDMSFMFFLEGLH